MSEMKSAGSAGADGSFGGGEIDGNVWRILVRTRRNAASEEGIVDGDCNPLKNRAVVQDLRSQWLFTRRTGIDGDAARWTIVDSPWQRLENAT